MSILLSGWWRKWLWLLRLLLRRYKTCWYICMYYCTWYKIITANAYPIYNTGSDSGYVGFQSVCNSEQYIGVKKNGKEKVPKKSSVNSAKFLPQGIDGVRRKVFVCLLYRYILYTYINYCALQYRMTSICSHRQVAVTYRSHLIQMVVWMPTEIETRVISLMTASCWFHAWLHLSRQPKMHYICIHKNKLTYYKNNFMVLICVSGIMHVILLFLFSLCIAHPCFPHTHACTYTQHSYTQAGSEYHSRKTILEWCPWVLFQMVIAKVDT